jgi:hypothetical protein
MAENQLASPLSTSGAGHVFEYRVAAIMLVHLLCRSHPPGLQVPVVEVALQQSVRGNDLDDIVVFGDLARCARNSRSSGHGR